jgi:hypothetical protein
MPVAFQENGQLILYFCYNTPLFINCKIKQGYYFCYCYNMCSSTVQFKPLNYPL